MSEPQRRETRKTHLDAAQVPIERALLALAAEIRDTTGDHDPSLILTEVYLSAQFCALAEELHWW